MMVPLLLLGLLATTIGADQGQHDLQEFTKGNNLFTAALYREVKKSTKDNFVVSPLSAQTVLALTQSGAKDATGEEVRSALSLPHNQEQIEAAFRVLLQNLNSERFVKLSTANRIYVQNGYKINDGFSQIANDVFGAGAENVNFAVKDAAAHTINMWVEERTGGKIRELIDAKSLDELTRVVLVNALHFKGQWLNKFDDLSTSKEDFYRSPNDVAKVDMMHVTKVFNYYESPELQAKYLELPYKGGNLSMVIVLPNARDGLAQLEGQIDRVFAVPQFNNERVIVSLPKFIIESKVLLVDVLKNLGVRKIFSEEADLSGIAGKKGDLYVSDVVQKAFINVTEDGTEAAAATAATAVLLSSADFYPKAESKIFNANHPFIFYIQNNEVVLFGGRVSFPKSR